MTDVRTFTVGPIQENAYIVRADPAACGALLVDPGEEPERLLDAARGLGVQIEAILITHCHFDHIGAVAPVARATGAPVYCPEAEAGLLADINAWAMGFGPFESYDADHTLKGGERLSLAGLDIDVLFTPGHSPGHMTYAARRSGGAQPSELPVSQTAEQQASQTAERQASVGGGPGTAAGATVLLSGDVLFQGSVGRVDLPGGDWPTLERSIGELVRRFAPETVVYPGHMGATTLGRELQSNPFLAGLRAGARV